MFYHVCQINDYLFWVSSQDADYRYIVKVEKDQMKEAMEIADEEACKWGGPDEDELGEEYDYYYNAGYVEVVQNALEKANIHAEFYTEMGKES